MKARFMMRIAKSSTKNEQGFASIAVALILIVVLSLVLVGFAELTRREQQNTLNDQLGTQAYYAAESGINDTIAALPGIGSDPNVNSGKCLTSAMLTPTISGPDGVYYSCVILNTTTNNLFYNPVAADSAKTVTTGTTAPLSSLTIQWSLYSTSGSKGTPLPGAPGNFYPTAGAATNWPATAPGVLEFSVTPVPTGIITRQNLIKTQFTAYLYPTSASGSNSVNYNLSTAAGTTDGKVIGGNCSTATGVCSAKITGIGGTSGQQYLIHFLDLYNPSTVTITANSSGSPTSFVGGQTLIDVTGRAKDVLKRLQVRVDGTPSNLPNYAIEAQNICKREIVAPASAGGTTFDNSFDASCQPVISPAPTPPTAIAIVGGGGGTNQYYPPGSGEPGAEYQWNHPFENESPASQDAEVSGCVWHFSDTNETITNQNCKNGDYQPHKFPEPANFETQYPYPTGCNINSMTVTLTEKLSGGIRSSPYSRTVTYPECYK